MSAVFLTACTPADEPAAPNSAADMPVTQLSAEQIPNQALVLDAHADIEIPGKESRYVGADGLSKVSPAKMRAGGTDAVLMAVAVGPGPRDAAGYA
jgi:membrane dipeptidase